LSIFRKTIENIQVPLKFDKNKGHHFTCRPIYIIEHISLTYSWNERYSKQKL